MEGKSEFSRGIGIIFWMNCNQGYSQVDFENIPEILYEIIFCVRYGSNTFGIGISIFVVSVVVLHGSMICYKFIAYEDGDRKIGVSVVMRQGLFIGQME